MKELGRGILQIQSHKNLIIQLKLRLVLQIAQEQKCQADPQIVLFYGSLKDSQDKDLAYLIY